LSSVNVYDEFVVAYVIAFWQKAIVQRLAKFAAQVQPRGRVRAVVNLAALTVLVLLGTICIGEDNLHISL
jgi:hypothetical protein